MSRANRLAGRNIGRAMAKALAAGGALARNAVRNHAAGNALMSHRFANAGWHRNGAIGNRFLANRWAHAGWYRNWWRNRVVFGWWGPVFWPYAYYDVFASVFWPYAYWPYVYDPFWYYGYPDLYAGIFWRPATPPAPRATQAARNATPAHALAAIRPAERPWTCAARPRPPWAVTPSIAATTRAT